MSQEDLPSPSDFRFHKEIEVRFRDLDAMGHVNNAAYMTYFEMGRTGYMAAIGHCSADACCPRWLARRPWSRSRSRSRKLYGDAGNLARFLAVFRSATG